MDGILISSLDAVERSWTKWARMRGVDPALAVRTAHGCRAVETVGKLRPDLDSQEELKLIEKIELGDTEGIQILPGVRALMETLPEDRWTVVTSATDKLARVRLAAGGIEAPARLVAADRVRHGKPHPEPFLAGAKLLGFKPEECVVFEDSASGTKAARAAGCIVVATTFSHPIETLGAAHYLIEGLKDVEASRHGNGLVLRLTPLG
jgi:sugar-phosphatase